MQYKVLIWSLLLSCICELVHSLHLNVDIVPLEKKKPNSQLVLKLALIKLTFVLKLLQFSKLISGKERAPSSLLGEKKKRQDNKKRSRWSEFSKLCVGVEYSDPINQYRSRRIRLLLTRLQKQQVHISPASLASYMSPTPSWLLSNRLTFTQQHRAKCVFTFGAGLLTQQTEMEMREVYIWASVYTSCAYGCGMQEDQKRAVALPRGCIPQPETSHTSSVV